ncbi:MAG: SDR family oxidoreductase [Opitutales bacterium]|nr:SDR family oxidoreductase [Opitutales bacterium]
MPRLDSKVALITGASEGLGRELALAFAAEGASVVLAARSAAKLEAFAAELKDAGHRALPVVCDVGDSAQVEAAVAATIAAFGRIDVLINNAAVAIPGDITDQTEEDWMRLLNINLLGVFRGIKFALPHMLEQGSGSIINMASIQGDRSWNHWTTYAAAKGAMKAMTRQLAGQYGKSGVRFNCISPGAMDTPMNRERRKREGDAFYESNKRMHALGRMGRPDEVNGAAIFLASDESSFVTGTDLVVDGGLSVLPRE